jgi:cytochrome c-type biogenesis protein CcmF
MCVAHFGVGVFILGATIASAYNLEVDLSARPGERLTAGGYEFVFRNIRTVEGANFVADEGEFELRKDGRLISVLAPQKRIYRVQPTPMTEAAIDVGMTRDVFVALGEPLGDSAWSVRLQVKPLIRLVWIGALIMAFGGLLAISDRRYRQSAREPVAVGKTPAVPATERV